MISLEKVEESILELEQKDTCFATCEKLALLYVVRDHLRGYSAAEPRKIDTKGESEFLQAVNGRNQDAAWAVMDDLMEDIGALHPRMYERVLERIKQI